MKSLFSSILWLISLILASNRLLADDSTPQQGTGGKLPLPSFVVSWADDKTVYVAGEIAVIKVKILDDSFSDKNLNLSRYAMNLSLSVRGKKGNSSYISGVIPYFEGDPSYWNVSFTPIRAGEFSVEVTEDNSGITDSSLQFFVTPGHIYPSACEVSWMNLVNEFVAGMKAYLRVIPKDAFGNNISSVSLPKGDYFVVSGSYENGTAAVVLDFRNNGWSEYGYIILEFVPITSGSLLLHAFGDNRTLSGSPLHFLVKPGSISITNSLARWKYGASFLQIFSKLEIFIHQKDQFGNSVPGLYAFDARVVHKATNLSVPVADLFFQEVSEGVQLLSFSVTEPGEFMLTIFNAKLNESISNMPYQYTVFIGYCHGLNSFVNGSGLANSISGRMSHFIVYLEDLYHNPSPVEAQWLQVQIFSKNSTFIIHPVMWPLRNTNGTAPSPVLLEGRTESLSILPADEDRPFAGNASVLASKYSITYTAEKSGEYEIWVLCGNIALNNGHPYLMTVFPGMVDTSFSSVFSFTSRVGKLMRNMISVQLLDAYLNPVSSEEAKLSFDIKVSNSSSFMTWAFVDNKDGSYVGYYMSRALGAYNMCILYEDKPLAPCPFEIQVYERDYFAEANNDSISVWEDESVAFNVLANDYVPGGQFTIAGFSMAWSILLHDHLYALCKFSLIVMLDIEHVLPIRIFLEES
ncbi:protein GAMETE EXPRESSED 2-like [Asparagus officinalis]|uniref:protein GAMETE EXPRESSED 2-like n=1 Tax=Asparagus officinalis TaxID=4686 RepID=UPI00098DF72A|nr:protein GAMETE EXPRESSED 2-like [Asparagus officinalis]